MKKNIILIFVPIYISNIFGLYKTNTYKINKNLIIERFIEQEKTLPVSETGIFKISLQNSKTNESFDIGELTYYIKRKNGYPFSHNKVNCHIQRLEINKIFQKNGYGNILIAFACKQFIKEGATEITLFATPLASQNYKQDLLRLFEFYKKHGFKHVEGESNEMILKIKRQMILSKL